MSSFRSHHFSKMTINPFGISKEFVKEVEEGRLQTLLRPLYEIKKHKTLLPNLAAYILFLYDKKSPLRDFFPDLEQRKNEAIDLAQITKENVVKELKLLKITEVREAILFFLKNQHSKEWALLITNEELLWEIQHGIMHRYDDFSSDKQLLDAYDVKTKLSNKADNLISLIHKYEDMVFGGDLDIKQASEEKRYGTNPEAFSKNVLKTP